MRGWCDTENERLLLTSSSYAGARILSSWSLLMAVLYEGTFDKSLHDENCDPGLLSIAQVELGHEFACGSAELRLRLK